MTLIVAIDIGGTFTDLLGYDPSTGRMLSAKCPSTPGDLAHGHRDAAWIRFSFARATLVSVRAWLHCGHQHGAGAEGRAHRSGGDAGHSRRLQNRTRQPPRGLQHSVQAAGAPGSRAISRSRLTNVWARRARSAFLLTARRLRVWPRASLKRVRRQWLCACYIPGTIPRTNKQCPRCWPRRCPRLIAASRTRYFVSTGNTSGSRPPS